MISWLRKIFGLRTAIEARQQNPAVAETVKACAEIYQRIPLRQYIDAEASDNLARKHFLEISTVCNAADPASACRERLVAAMLRYALFQVLVIPVPPAKDFSGLRGLPGISGELGSQIETLAVRNIDLRADIHASPHFSDRCDVARVVTAEFWKSLWLLETMDAARHALGDHLAVNDWFRPFAHAACANQENRYRIDLDWPSAFSDAEKTVAPTAYSIFTDIVISGAKDPLAEWLAYHEGMQVTLPGGVQPGGTISILRASNSE